LKKTLHLLGSCVASTRLSVVEAARLNCVAPMTEAELKKFVQNSVPVVVPVVAGVDFCLVTGVEDWVVRGVVHFVVDGEVVAVVENVVGLSETQLKLLSWSNTALKGARHEQALEPRPSGGSGKFSVQKECITKEFELEPHWSHPSVGSRVVVGVVVGDVDAVVAVVVGEVVPEVERVVPGVVLCDVEGLDIAVNLRSSGE